MSFFDGIVDLIGPAVGLATGNPLMAFGGSVLGGLLGGDDAAPAQPAGFGGDSDMERFNVNSAETYAERDYSREGDDIGGPLSGAQMPGVNEDGIFSGGESTFPVTKVIDTAIRGAGALAPFATGAAGYAGQADTNRTMREIADAANAFNAQQAQDAFDRSSKFNAAEAALGRDFSASQSAIGRDFSSSQAQKAMDFSERMSNTQWQRAVADMSAAGLNPMLAYMRGPASAPSGFAGSASVGSAPTASASSGFATASIPQVGNKMSAGINSAGAGAGVMKALEEIENIIAHTVKTYEADMPYVKGQTALSREQMRRIDSEIEKIVADTRLSDAQRGQVIVNTVLRELDVPKARNEAEAEDSWWKRKVAPYLPDALRGSNSASSLRRAFGR